MVDVMLQYGADVNVVAYDHDGMFPSDGKPQTKDCALKLAHHEADVI